MDEQLKELLVLLKKGGIQKELIDQWKKLGSQDEMQEFYNILKKLGLQMEQKANEGIQNSLNKKEIIKLLHRHSHIIAKIIEYVKEYLEVVSIPLNIPTKNDVANVAKLALQNEEKLDLIEEQLIILNQYLKQFISEEVPTYTVTKAKKVKLDSDKERKQYKKLKLLNAVMQSSSNPLT